MAVIAFVLPRRMEVGEGGRKLFSLLFISGLVTIFIGTITGGIFGIHLQQMPQSLAPLKRLALFNPMKEPMTFLLIALGVGVVHLVSGICVEMVDNLRRGRTAAAILDQCSWLVLIVGLLLAAIPFAGTFFGQQDPASGQQIGFSLAPNQLIHMYESLPVYSQTGVILALAGIIVLFVFAGRHSKSIGKRFAKGAYEVYGIIQLLADILSYSRLLALGLATSVIATVVNTIAGMAGEMPYVGPVFFVVILIIGHLGNLLINALSGFIHTARLQFVEFFTKFYQGGGYPFEPLRREGKYTIIRQDAS